MDGDERRGRDVCGGGNGEDGGKTGETTSGTMGAGWDWRQYRSTIPTPTDRRDQTPCQTVRTISTHANRTDTDIVQCSVHSVS